MRFVITSGVSRMEIRDFSCGSDFDIFEVGSVNDITRALVSGMYPSGTGKVSPNRLLNRSARSRVISMCCRWSSPTGTRFAR